MGNETLGEQYDAFILNRQIADECKKVWNDALEEAAKKAERVVILDAKAGHSGIRMGGREIAREIRDLKK